MQCEMAHYRNTKTKSCLLLLFVNNSTQTAHHTQIIFLVNRLARGNEFEYHDNWKKLNCSLNTIFGWSVVSALSIQAPSSVITHFTTDWYSKIISSHTFLEPNETRHFWDPKYILKYCRLILSKWQHNLNQDP